MNKHPVRFRPVAMSMLLILVWVMGTVSSVNASQPPDHSPVVDPALLAMSQQAEPLDFIITFSEQADLSAAYGMDWEARGWYVYETLTTHSEATQMRVRQFLDNRGVTYQPFWAGNLILVEAAPSAVLNGLMNFTEIAALQSTPQVMLIEPETAQSVTGDSGIQGAMSNLVHIKANQVWDLGITGEGLVVGSIDTGARLNHEALVDQYRGNQDGSFDHNHSWWDPVTGSSAPIDDHGHGSHVTGIMTGTDGAGNKIGIAPGAQWIACKAFTSSGSSEDKHLIACGQFMLAPWDLDKENENPALRPHVVNNSWGDCKKTYDDWYETIIDNWLAAGIYPVFASGNAGNCGYPSPPGLNSVGNPARSHHVTAVGSTGNHNGQYATHSNWGPTDSLDTTINPNGYPDLKPQVVAPGVSIRSAWASSNTSYSTLSGTSMSSPHVTGLVALIWQAAPCLVGDYAATETLMEQTATPILYDDGSPDTPGHPNYATGWGEIDAYAAVTTARNACGDVALKGVVKDQATQQRLSSVRISVNAHNSLLNDRSGLSDEAGDFEILVFSGESYDITVKKFGYEPLVIKDIEVTSPGQEIILEIFLTPLNKIYFPLFISQH